MKPMKLLLLLLRAVPIAVSFPLASIAAQVTFPGPELLGRPQDTSITINVVASAAIQVYFEIGTQSGMENQTSLTSGTASSPLSAAANQPLVAVLSGLTPDTQYYYYMVYRSSGTSSWTTRPEHSFHTARAAGHAFTFTVTSDSHINIVLAIQPCSSRPCRTSSPRVPTFTLTWATLSRWTASPPRRKPMPTISTYEPITSV